MRVHVIDGSAAALDRSEALELRTKFCTAWTNMISFHLSRLYQKHSQKAHAVWQKRYLQTKLRDNLTDLRSDNQCSQKQ